MSKLYVISPYGEHKVIEIGATGDYFDTSNVLWDERFDGAMPVITLGTMQRIGNSLIAQIDYSPEHQAAVRKKLVPDSVPMPAAKQVMIEQGILDDVEAFIATLKPEEQVWYTDSIFIRRDDELVEKFRVYSGKTAEEIDNLFIAGDIINKQRYKG